MVKNLIWPSRIAQFMRRYPSWTISSEARKSRCKSPLIWLSQMETRHMKNLSIASPQKWRRILNTKVGKRICTTRLWPVLLQLLKITIQTSSFLCTVLELFYQTERTPKFLWKKVRMALMRSRSNGLLNVLLWMVMLRILRSKVSKESSKHTGRPRHSWTCGVQQRSNISWG